MNVHPAGSRIVALMLSLAVSACSAGEGESKGGLELRFNDEAIAEDAGLPTYPGARPYKDADESSSGANFRLSTSLFGLKVAAMNLETRDKPERVAEFYRRALERYGRVLECPGGTDGREKSMTSADAAHELVCEPDDPGSHSVVYKAGVKDNQRIVAIKPHAGGTRFSLVHVDVREDEER